MTPAGRGQPDLCGSRQLARRKQKTGIIRAAAAIKRGSTVAFFQVFKSRGADLAGSLDLKLRLAESRFLKLNFFETNFFETNFFGCGRRKS
jgi:hypothetical protein